MPSTTRDSSSDLAYHESKGPSFAMSDMDRSRRSRRTIKKHAYSAVLKRLPILRIFSRCR